jgi:hypothetical protein
MPPYSLGRMKMFGQLAEAVGGIPPRRLQLGFEHGGRRAQWRAGGCPGGAIVHVNTRKNTA